MKGDCNRKEHNRIPLDVFISTRLQVSYQRLKETPAYQEKRSHRDRIGVTADDVLQKLNQRDRTLVQDHISGEMALAYLEQIEAYLQGLRDCVPLLTFLGLLHSESAL